MKSSFVAQERPWRASYRYEGERDSAWRHGEWQRREGEHRRHEWDRSLHAGRRD